MNVMHLTRYHGVFGIEIDCCVRCRERLRIIASIEEPQVIARILSHLQRAAPQQYPRELSRGGGLKVRSAPGLGHDVRIELLEH